MNIRGSVLLEALACVVVVGIGSTFIMQAFRAQQAAVEAQRDQAVVLSLLEERIGLLSSGMVSAGSVPAHEFALPPLGICSFESAAGPGGYDGEELLRMTAGVRCSQGKNVRRQSVDVLMAERKNADLPL